MFKSILVYIFVCGTLGAAIAQGALENIEHRKMINNLYLESVK